MRTPESDPEGFEPQLLRYFTSFELATGAGNSGSQPTNEPEESGYLNSAIRAFEAVRQQGLAVGNLEGIQL